MLRLRRTFIGGLLGAMAGAAASRAVDDPEIRGIGVELPGMLQADGNGSMNTLMRAVMAQYGKHRSAFAVVPRARALLALREQTSDFAYPFLAPLDGTEVDPVHGFRYGSFPVGRAAFVIYSRRSAPVTRADIDAATSALQRGGSFALRIGALPYFNWGFPHEQMLNPQPTDWQRLAAGRLDAIVYGQEGGDYFLRRAAEPGLHRAHFADLTDVFAYPDGPRGRFVEAALDRTLQQMKQQGLLGPLQLQVHRPYDPRQP